MRYPAFLKENGTIGFAAPSCGAADEPYYSAFQNALFRFQKRGYQTVLGPNVYKNTGIGISATPKECGDELTEMYLRDDVDCIITTGGGELMCEALEYIDFEAIKNATPKWYMGYSDNTNFSYLSATLCDTAAFYSPCAPSFGMEPMHPALLDALAMLKGEINVSHGYDLWEMDSLKDAEHPLVPYHVTEKTELKFENFDGTPFTGRTIGGCMDVLVNLLGTRFDHTKEFLEKYKDDGIIWFLEACDLNIFGIRRALWQMKQAGWFKYVKGFVFGRPVCFGQAFMGLDQYSAVIEPLKEFDVPIIMDADIGHRPPMMPMIEGALGTVQKYGASNISITYNFK